MRPFAKHRLLSGLLALLVLAAAAAAVLGASHAAANQKPATLPVKAEPRRGSPSIRTPRPPWTPPT